MDLEVKSSSTRVLQVSEHSRAVVSKDLDILLVFIPNGIKKNQFAFKFIL